MQNSKSLTKKLRDFLDERIDQSEIDWIICLVTNRKRNELLHGFEVSDEETRKIFKIAEKRAKGIPLCQIVGTAEFYGLEFLVDKNVLIPRFETELLVETVIKNIEKGHGLDIGVGSGVIAVTLNKLKNLKMTAVDISRKALRVAKKNAKKHMAEVELLRSDLFAGLKDQNFDFIISNPPYIKSEDIETLQTEVKDHEPRLALDGGEDGFDFYRRIIAEAPRFLKEGGMIFFEIGINQSDEIAKLLEKDFEKIVVIKDYSQIDRIIYATKRR